MVFGLVSKRIDVRKHVLVPKHEKLSDKEKEEVLLSYHASVENFPRILKKDAALFGEVWGHDSDCQEEPYCGADGFLQGGCALLNWCKT